MRATRVITLVCCLQGGREAPANSRDRAEYKEAFALFDKKGTGAIPREVLGDLLRALGQNPTQAEVADIVSKAPREGKIFPSWGHPPRDLLIVHGIFS